MSKNDRKQRKKKERQKRLQQQKHLRHYGPGNQELEYDDLDDEPMDYGLELPSPTVTERMMRKFAKGPSLLGKIGSLIPGLGHRDNREAARELAYDAMEQSNPVKAVELARKALTLDPDCADALCTIALSGANSRPEAIRLLEEAVAAGERSLGGPDYFEEHRGHFWGLIDTRPYMRARSALADLLHGEGRLAEAIRHYEALLELNPNDNQGIRDILLGCYFEADNLEGVRRLFDQYEADSSTIFLFGHVLERFLAGDLEEAAELLQQAHKNNPHAKAYLTGKRNLPRHLPDYYSPGDENEAIFIGYYMSEAWRRHPKAVAWLKSTLG